MARLRAVVVAQDTDGDVWSGATVKFYQPGTGTASGTSTSGTPYAGSLYAAVSGGSPISTTQTADTNGTVTVYTAAKSRFDVGIEPGNGVTARVRAYETFEFDPADVMTSVSGEQSVIQTGTLAAPSLAWTSDLDTGFNVDSDGDVAVVKDGVGVLEVSGTTTYLRSPDGTEAATLTDAGVFAVPGLLRSVKRYLLSNYCTAGYTTSGTAPASAATNKTALQSLLNDLWSVGGGTIIVNDFFPLTGGLTINGASGTGSISFEGIRGEGGFCLYGTSGDFFEYGATNTVTKCGIYNLFMFHNETPTSGSTIRLKTIDDFEIEGLRLLRNSTSVAAHTGIEANNGFSLRRSRVLVRDGSVNAVGVKMSNTSATTRHLNIMDTEIEQDVGASGIGTGLLFQNTGTIDTISLHNAFFKGFSSGIRSGTVAGSVANFQMVGGFIDGCVWSVRLEPYTGATYATFQFSDVWMSGTTYNVQANVANGGTLSSLLFNGGYYTNAATRGVDIAGCSGVEITGGEYATVVNGGGDAGIWIGPNGSNVVLRPSVVTVNSSAAASILVESTVTPVTVAPGVVRGKRAVVNGTLSSARVVVDHAFAA